MTQAECTLDHFLGGRIIAAQPKQGFRAGHDTVLLAAAVPAAAGEPILELGAGAGIASLCVARRVPGAHILGIEIDSALVAIANENVGRNDLTGRVRFETADARQFAGADAAFRHVFFNPPFHAAEGTISNVASRELAKRDLGCTVVSWTSTAMRLCQPGGTVTAIVRADRVQEMLRATTGNRIVVLPLHPRKGEAPKRMVVQVTLGQPASVHYTAGLVLHCSDRNTDEAEAVLRGGEPLRLSA